MSTQALQALQAEDVSPSPDVYNVGTDHLADPPTGVNGIASKRKSTCASGRIDEETELLKQAAPPIPVA